jgi:hypothetical protein
MGNCILKNLANDRLMFQNCGDFDVYAEINGPRGIMDNGTPVQRNMPRLFLPQHHYLDKIHEQYPNATFILNVRPVNDWALSVIRWNRLLEIEFINEFFEQQYHERNVSQLPLDMKRPTSRADKDRFLHFIFEFHNNHVREFVRSHPSHAFLEVDITHNGTGQLLADTFGLDASCWGHHNQNKYRGGTSKN